MRARGYVVRARVHAPPPPSRASRARAGENFDARLVQPGWDKCGFANASAWAPAVAADASAIASAAIVSHLVPVTIDEDFAPAAVVALGPTTYVCERGAGAGR